MSPLNQHLTLSTSMGVQQVLSGTGGTLVKLKQDDSNLVNDSTTHVMLNNNSESLGAKVQMKIHGFHTSTPESPHKNKVKIWDVKSRSSRKRTRNTQLLKTSGLASTSNAKDYVPFWTSSTKVWSEKLWSCIETDLQDSGLTYWNTFSSKKELNSWFTVRTQVPNQKISSQLTFSPSQPYLWQVITANEQAKTESVVEQTKKKRKQSRSKSKKVYKKPVRARTIRVYPNVDDKETLKQWFGVHRWVYNQGVHFARAYMTKEEWALKEVDDIVEKSKRENDKGKTIRMSNKDAVRSIIRRYKEQITVKQWIAEVPECVRDTAVSDLVNSIFSTKAAEFEDRTDGNKRKDAFMQFRRKNTRQHTLSFPKRELGQGKKGKIASLVNRLFRRKGKRYEKQPEATAEVKIKMNRLGRVFMVFPREVDVMSDDMAPSSNKHSVASLDPGDRTFQTIYDVDGQVVHWGEADKDKVKYLMKQCDNIQRKIAIKGPKWGLRKAYHRYLYHIKNKITEIHRKIALFLCQNYRVVIVGELSTQKCLNNKEKKRVIGKDTSRTLQQWSHYSFRQILKQKAELNPWCKIIEYNEAYTSKTCGYCGKYNDMGGSKDYKCSCGFVMDRDLNGARNILLRYLTLEKLKIIHG